ncbi:hypothetical protein [Microcoleus sp. S13_B4]|uniref:hypothetical protein n=1 Tax=Microcoleus sp. S13_B4 TaxID=3055408 RepID=UPI002FD46D85
MAIASLKNDSSFFLLPSSFFHPSVTSSESESVAALPFSHSPTVCAKLENAMVGEETCVPSQGVGGNGIASEFGDLTGMNRQEIDDFLRGLGAEIRTTRDGYVEYKFFDKSTVMIRPNGEVIRTPAPKYGSDGKNLNKGLRLDRDGKLLRTRDEFGNLIIGTHNTGEKLNE